MLNPYFIEKDSLSRVALIQKYATELRVSLSKHILSTEENIEPIFRKELQSYINVDTPQPSKYECRFCKKKFNDGRKLGGHVSRSHKNEIKENDMIDEQE